MIIRDHLRRLAHRSSATEVQDHHPASIAHKVKVAGLRAQTRTQQLGHSSYAIALLCTWIGFILAAVPLCGWLIDSRFLPRLAAGSQPTWPVISVGYTALTASLLATIKHKQRLAIALISIPALFGIAAIIKHVLNIGPHLDHLVLREGVSQSQALGAGAPGYHAAITFLLLTTGVALANLHGRRSGKIMSILASLTLGFSTLSASLIIQGAGRIDTDWGPLVGSLPAALSSAFLSIGLLAWRAESGWGDLINNEGAEWRALRLAFPVVLTAPTLILTLRFWLIRSGALAPLPAEFLSLGLTMLVVSGLLFWCVNMVIRERASVQELRSALDSTAVALTDLDGKILHWSQGCVDLYGWTADEAIGRHKRDLVAPGVFPSAQDHADGHTELVEISRDGRELRVLQQIRRLERRGTDAMLVMSMIDVTERTRAQDALRESEARLAMAVDAHGIGIFDWDVKSGVIDWSAGAGERLGLEAGSLHDYDRWQALVDPDDLATINNQIDDATRTKAERFGFKFRINQPDGSTRSIEGSARAFYDEAGELIRTLGVNVDVTQREERQTRLQAREAQLVSVLETVPDAMVVINEAGQILSFSRTAEQLFGYSAEEVIGRNISILTPAEHQDKHTSYLTRYLTTGDKRVIGNNRLLTAIAADGREIPIELRVGEAIAAGERLFTGFIRDISQRLDNEERLNTLRSELTHLSRLGAMGEMAAGLAHELNQPLAASANFVATASLLLEEDAEPELVRDMLDQARAQVLRAGDIIRRLRDFVSRRDSEVRAERVDETLRDAVALVLVGQKQLDVTVRYELDPAAVFMFADRVQIQQVLVNLLRNALEAMRSADVRHMNILMQSNVIDAETVEIAISDNGPGLPADFFQENYAPFFSTKGEAGMGVGLSISRRIIEAHGGELLGENMPEGGARFRFTVPMINETELELP